MQYLFFVILFCIGIVLFRKKSVDLTPIKMKEEYERRLDENMRENRMTEHPVSDLEVVEFTKQEMIKDFGDSFNNIIKN